MQGLIQVGNRVFMLNNADACLFTPPEDGKPANLSMFGHSFHHYQVEGDEAEQAWAWIQSQCSLRLGVEATPEVDEIGQPIPQPDRVAAAPIDASCLVKSWPHRAVYNVSKMALVIRRDPSDKMCEIDVTWMDGTRSPFSFALGREIWRLFGERHLDCGRFRVNVAGVATAHRAVNDLGEPWFTLDWGAGYNRSFHGPTGEKIWNAVNKDAIVVNDGFEK